MSFDPGADLITTFSTRRGEFTVSREIKADPEAFAHAIASRTPEGAILSSHPGGDGATIFVWRVTTTHTREA